MGIEPTQPDEVRSRTVLKTVRATRLHPLPRDRHASTRPCGPRRERPRRSRRSRARAKDIRRRDPAGTATSRPPDVCGSIEQCAIDLGRAAPVDARLEIRRVPLGAAGANSALPRLARARQAPERDRALNDDRDVARRGDVRRVAEQAEARDVGRARAPTASAARLAFAFSLHIDAYSASRLGGSQIAALRRRRERDRCRAAW